MKRLIIMAALAACAAEMVMAQEHGGHDHETNAQGELIHDEMNMPALNGKDTTDVEVDALRQLFQNHGEIERHVTLLPNGIETLTSTEDEELRGYLISHIDDMIARVEQGRDPEVPIQSKTLDGIFEGRRQIQTELEYTDTGVKLVQISDDPDIVELLHIHAAEIDDMVARGMEAVHERMSKEAQK